MQLFPPCAREPSYPYFNQPAESKNLDLLLYYYYYYYFFFFFKQDRPCGWWMYECGISHCGFWFVFFLHLYKLSFFFFLYYNLEV